MSTYRWIRTNLAAGYEPITQVYGICFDRHHKILICKKPLEPWSLPGGKPIPGETMVETLKRELLEEVDATVEAVRLLGFQEIDGEYYQARCIANITELLPQTLDPDTGLQFERKMVSLGEIGKYINWGDRGKVMFEQAVELHLK